MCNRASVCRALLIGVALQQRFSPPSPLPAAAWDAESKCMGGCLQPARLPDALPYMEAPGSQP